MKPMEKITNYYWYTQKNGAKMRVKEIQEYVDVTNFSSDGREFIPGLKSYIADNGFHLNALPDGTFEIAETREIVTLRH